MGTQSFTTTLPPLVVPVGVSNGTSYDLDKTCSDGVAISVFGPSNGTAGTFQVDPKKDGNWYTLQIGGVDQATPLAGKFIQLTELANLSGYLRIVLAVAAVGTDASYPVVKSFTA